MKIVDTQALGALEECTERPRMSILLHGYGYYFILTFVSGLRAESGPYTRKRKGEHSTTQPWEEQTLP